jgi:hypothetical protein
MRRGCWNAGRTLVNTDELEQAVYMADRAGAAGRRPRGSGCNGSTTGGSASTRGSPIAAPGVGVRFQA